MNNPNQLHPELLGLSALQPWDGANSSGRKYMFSSHLGQSLPIAEPTERRTQTGMERQFGKFTNNIKMPCDAKIIKVLDLYPRSFGYNYIEYTPMVLVVYEDENGTIGCLEITNYHYNYYYYGFKYQAMSGMSKLREGEYVAKDTVFMDSTAVTEDGAYRYGRECNIAFLSLPGTAEDGFIISESLAAKFGYRTYEKRVVSWGRDKFPINLYGDDNNYKPFPDIGEKVHPNNNHKGLIMALRDYDEDLSVIDQSKHNVRVVDTTFDECVYASGAEGTVVDIRVFHDSNSSLGGTDPDMSIQPEKYDKARRIFYSEIVKLYKRLQQERREGLSLTPEFHRMVVEAISVVGGFHNPGESRERVEMLYRKKPLDEWRLEFTVEYFSPIGIGNKLTDTDGGKGVVCRIFKDEDMPVDENGVRADIVADPNATFSRMNLGRIFETYVNSASRDLTVELRQRLGVTGQERGLARALEGIDRKVFNEAWERLMGYYKAVSPRMYRWFTEGAYPNKPEQHLAEVLKDGIYLYIPTDNEPEYMEYIEHIENFYKPTYSRVKLRNKDGSYSWTKDPVRIAGIYMILLEKTGSDWAATASGKVQQHGILAPLSSMDKYSSPARQQPTRAMGEAEVRSFTSYVDPMTTSDVLDRNNNPEVHKELVKNIMRAPKPTDVEELVDRKEYPLGFSKPLQIAKHMAFCGGWVFDYQNVTTLSNKPKIKV